MKNDETCLHKTCVEYVRTAYPEVIIHHSPNELGLRGENAAREINKRKKLGMRVGWPDLELFYMGRVLFIELKIEKRKVTKLQDECHTDLTMNGFDVVVIRSVVDFIHLVDRWVRLSNYRVSVREFRKMQEKSENKA